MKKNMLGSAELLGLAISALTLASSAQAVTFDSSASLSDITVSFSDSSGQIDPNQYSYDVRALNPFSIEEWGGASAIPTKSFSGTSGSSTVLLSLSPTAIGSAIHYDAPSFNGLYSHTIIEIGAIVPVGVTVTVSAQYSFSALSTAIQPDHYQDLSVHIHGVGFDANLLPVYTPSPDIAAGIAPTTGIISSVFTNTSTATEFGYSIDVENNAYRSVQSVPEPDTWALAFVGLGLTGAGLARKRGRSRSSDQARN